MFTRQNKATHLPLEVETPSTKADDNSDEESCVFELFPMFDLTFILAMQAVQLTARGKTKEMRISKLS